MDDVDDRMKSSITNIGCSVIGNKLIKIISLIFYNVIHGMRIKNGGIIIN